MPADPAKVLIVAENCSAIFGGEAILPLHYFRRLRARGVEAWLLTHARNRERLLALLPAEADRMHFAPDTLLNRLSSRLLHNAPTAVGRVIGPILGLFSQFTFRRLALRITRVQGINLVHQPSPVSPRAVSLLFGLGAPVVIGPLNGGMSYPPGFKQFEGKAGRASVAVGRLLSNLLHYIFPGKLRADLVLVANERTRRALPKGVRGLVIECVENGVDLSLWKPQAREDRASPIRFVFSGRLVDWKGVDCLLRAFARVVSETPATLDIFGDGTERGSLQKLASELGLEKLVTFHGWVDQPRIAAHLASADIFVLPSLWECGGAVVLEAMASGLPVIATRWGGPADYLDDTCGVLVDPTNPEEFVEGLAGAMTRLAHDAGLRERLAAAALARVRSQFDWEKKVDRMLEMYDQVRLDHLAKAETDQYTRDASQQSEVDLESSPISAGQA